MSTTSSTREEEARNRLLALAEQGQAYALLACAGDYLACIPHDDQVRAHALRGLVDLKLYSVAAEVAAACPPSSPSWDPMRRMADQFAAHPSDLIGVRDTDERFNANLGALRSRGERGRVLADRVEQAWRQMPPNLTLHQAGDGNRFGRAARSDGTRIWLPAIEDFAGRSEVVNEPEKLRGGFTAPFLFDGVGAGWMIPRLHAVTQGTYLNYSPAIYVVETNARAFALVLRLHDWTAVLGDERVILAVGPHAWTEWSGEMRAADELPEPRHALRLTRWPGDQAAPIKDILTRLYEARGGDYQEARAAADSIYAGRDAAWWAARYASAGSDDPLRVLCLTSRHTTFLQYSMRDLQAAFERAGMKTRLMVEQRDHVRLSATRMLDEAVAFRPDLVVVIDHHRRELADRFVGEVPFVCWIQDEIPELYSREAGRALGPLDFTIGFGGDRCVCEFGYPAERFMPCMLAVDPAKFAPPPGGAGTHADLLADLAYISHQAEPPAELHARVRGQISSGPAVELIDAFYEEMLPLMRSERFNAAYDLDGLLRRVQERTRVEMSDEESRSRLMGVYVRPLADRILRHVTLEWAADWADGAGRRLALWGRGWDRHPRFARYARGEARHGAHLGAIVRSSAINLHCGMNVALHQRVLETAVAGGFLLLRYHPHDFYEPGFASFYEFLRERNITRPCRIPAAEFPAPYLEARERSAGRTGRTLPDVIDIPAETFVEMQIGWQPGQPLRNASIAFPDLERITFTGPESFARQAEWFLARPDARTEIVERMRQSVQAHFTYDALVGRLVGFLRDRLAAGGGNPR